MCSKRYVRLEIVIYCPFLVDLMQLFRKYFLDFYIWWYWFNAARILRELRRDFISTLGHVNLIPMATNLFRPMFQDYSWEGKLAAFPIRLGWVLFGLIVMSFYIAITLIGFLGYLVIPVLPILAILNGVFKFA